MKKWFVPFCFLSVGFLMAEGEVPQDVSVPEIVVSDPETVAPEIEEPVLTDLHPEPCVENCEDQKTDDQ